MKTLSKIFLSAFLLSASLSFAAPFKVPDLSTLKTKAHVEVADIPALYHWTSIGSLKRLAAGATEATIPFKKVVDKNALIAQSFPQLMNRPAFFAWNNPVGGIGVSPQEIYSGAKDPALIKFTMKNNLKILVIESVDGQAPLRNLNLDGIDVIFHSRQNLFHEFLILNEKSILNFTADPKQIFADVNATVNFFKSTNWNNSRAETLYVAGDLFNFYGRLSHNFNEVVLPILNLWSKSGKDVPRLFTQIR